MADEKSGPPNKRRRPPTTIDLKATEVASEAAPKEEPLDHARENPQAASAEPNPQPGPEPTAAEKPRAAGWRERIDVSALNARMAVLRGRVGEGVNSRVIAAGGAGAAVLALLLLALW